MRSRLVARAIALVLATSACGTGTPASTSPALPSPAVATSVPTSIAPPVPTPTLPPVVGPDPSAKVGAFYYPWYGTPSIDGAWVHWTQGDRRPPTDIASDYYPRLGAYSSNDQLIVAQHMAWLRQAGVGVAITSWWGADTFEDRAVPLLLRMAERYGIKIAFHIEPYGTRTATRLRDDVQYLYQRYGTSPAFYRSTSASRYSTGGKATGMFFVWCVEFSGLCGSRKVEPGYWRDAVDAVHALPDGGLIIANTLQTSWVEADHFDGLYNYITLKADRGAFDWSRELPPGSLYIPSVAPGMSAKRIGYAPETYLTRDGGRTFDAQWTAALGTGVQPEMVTITSFNEWHEGTMIEPLALGASDSLGSPYSDFGAVAPDGYLSLTRTWIDRYAQVTWPASYRVRITVATTSDWTTVNVLSGGSWLRPERVSASANSTAAAMQDGVLLVTQSLADANTGRGVEAVFDVLFQGLDPAATLRLNIDRGNIGSSRLVVANYVGDAPAPVATFNWAGVTSGRNSFAVEVPSGLLTRR